jgi:glycosyltransferase involved in cell wall biosynthesis
VSTTQGENDGIRLSLAMIVRDAEATVGSVLADVVDVCDEIVVVDTGSDDETISIATRAGAEVHRLGWRDDFSFARNSAFDMCSGEWILWLDADDRVPAPAAEALRILRHDLAGRTDIDVVTAPYRVQFAPATDVCTFGYLRERLIRRDAGLRWSGPVHEAIPLPAGRVLHTDSLWVEHRPLSGRRRSDPDRNLRILQVAIEGGDRSPRTLFYYGNELRERERFDEALDVYHEYLTVSELEWERYAALLHMAGSAGALDRHDDRLTFLLQAVALDSRRAEAWDDLGVYFYERGEWARALPFFSAATMVGPPDDGFVSEAHYRWLPWDYLAVCLDRLDRPREAIGAALRAIEASPDSNRLVKNLHWMVDHVAGVSSGSP